MRYLFGIITIVLIGCNLSLPHELWTTTSAPAVTAESPQASVELFMEALLKSDIAIVRELVCEQYRQVMIESMSEPPQDVEFALNLNVQTISQDGDNATVRVEGTILVYTGGQEQPVEVNVEDLRVEGELVLQMIFEDGIWRVCDPTLASEPADGD